jgi:sugar/nucleoside kinase (ribokinase family)
MLKFPGINPVDYLVIGHITCDLTPDGDQLGGSASYASLTARALGQRVGMVTSWGEEAIPEILSGISIANNPSEVCTTFENKYTPEGRIQRLEKIASELAYYHIPESWRQSPIVHLAPVAQEVQPEIVRHFPNAHIYLTIQGWLRQWDSQGIVSSSEWPEARYILQQAHAAVLSEEDIQRDQYTIDAFAAAAPILVVTQGAEGATVYTEGRVEHIPAKKVTEVDPTGAGDIFAAAFFTHLTQNRDPIQAAEFATRIAADSVTRPGLTGTPTEERIDKIFSEVQ